MGVTRYLTQIEKLLKIKEYDHAYLRPEQHARRISQAWPEQMNELHEIVQEMAPREPIAEGRETFRSKEGNELLGLPRDTIATWMLRLAGICQAMTLDPQDQEGVSTGSGCIEYFEDFLLLASQGPFGSISLDREVPWAQLELVNEYNSQGSENSIRSRELIEAALAHFEHRGQWLITNRLRRALENGDATAVARP